MPELKWSLTAENDEPRAAMGARRTVVRPMKLDALFTAMGIVADSLPLTAEQLATIGLARIEQMRSPGDVDEDDADKPLFSVNFADQLDDHALADLTGRARLMPALSAGPMDTDSNAKRKAVGARLTLDDREQRASAGPVFEQGEGSSSALVVSSKAAGQDLGVAAVKLERA